MKTVLFSSLFIFYTLSPAQVLIDKQITIQPIYLSNGTVSANSAQILYEAEIDRIWSQAGIDVRFLTSMTYVNTTIFTNLSSDPTSLISLYNTPGQPWSIGTLQTNITRLFFVPIIDNSSSVYGYTLQNSATPDEGDGTPVFSPGRNGIAIANVVFSANRIDTIAHEIGHALGLNHNTHGAGGASNLMSDGGVRTSPSSITQIFPSGSIDMLTGAITTGNPDWKTEQIDLARSSPLSVSLPVGQQYIYTAVPEPEATVLASGLLVFSLVFVFRRRRVALL